MLWALLPGLGLPSLGEASFQEAINPDRAQCITVILDGRPTRAKLLMLGTNAMIFESDGKRYLSGSRGENPAKLG